MAKRWVIAVLGLISFSLLIFSHSSAVERRGTAFEPLGPVGPTTRIAALEPCLRKWYVPQELYYEFGWEQWRYTNYAKDTYKRYVPIALEGARYYDIFGNYITRGWQIYDWQEIQPRELGSQIFKSPRFSSWFDRLLISSASRGQYYSALTIGEEIRTTLTPLTFSKPTFNGSQLDILTDKYSFTALASRISNPGTPRKEDTFPPESNTDNTTLIGLRGVVRVARFAEIGATYVNAHNMKNIDDWVENTFKGRLTTGQNWGTVRRIIIRLSDDSPEDGEGGAMLFLPVKIYIDGRLADLGPGNPEITGGVKYRGHYEANGTDQIYLTFDLSRYGYIDEKGNLIEANRFSKISFELTLANDYKVEITSNIQLNAVREEIFLPVCRAPGNVKDGTNQRVVRFAYGLPTANEIYGLTVELTDIAGWNLRAEYNVNSRYRLFPNRNPKIEDKLARSTDKSTAYYVNISKVAFPWYGYGELFNIDYDYSTTAYIPDGTGNIYYDEPERFCFEFVDDNDDQDRYPDWRRKSVNQRAGNDLSKNDGIFPGLDENNDRVSDFNQNQNFEPDYAEPFLRYSVDPPEFLFGLDMNNNTVIDRFENDNDPDYPYKKDHRGYNFYIGAEVLPGLKLTGGYLNERLVSSGRRNRATYGLLTLYRDFAGIGRLQVFHNIKKVQDDIPDNLVQWVQPPGTKGSLQPFIDPLVTPNTTVNSSYAEFHYIGIPHANFINKVKYELYHQRESQPTLAKDARFLGIISKFDYTTMLRSFVLRPRIKSTYKYQTPYKIGESKTKELSEIVSLMTNFHLLPTTSIELGTEYTKFFDLMDRDKDYHEIIYAIQLSNTSDFLGYRITAKVGFRMLARYLKHNEVKSSSVAFMSVYAGVGG